MKYFQFEDISFIFKLYINFVSRKRQKNIVSKIVFHLKQLSIEMTSDFLLPQIFQRNNYNNYSHFMHERRANY